MIDLEPCHRQIREDSGWQTILLIGETVAKGPEALVGWRPARRSGLPRNQQESAALDRFGTLATVRRMAGSRLGSLSLIESSGLSGVSVARC
jgi:hypothetical protein